VRVEPPSSDDDSRWLTLRLRLWPQASVAEHLADMRASAARGDCICIAMSAAGVLLGLAEASMRTDYVNGTSGSPVPFLEGLYVEPDARRSGVARALVAAVGDWAMEHQAVELASDALLDNTVSHAVHRALGFVETERVVYFCKRLGSRR